MWGGKRTLNLKSGKKNRGGDAVGKEKNGGEQRFWAGGREVLAGKKKKGITKRGKGSLFKRKGRGKKSRTTQGFSRGGRERLRGKQEGGGR